jgi:TonB family protein
MEQRYRATHSPYGGWQLKASYQQNLLMANGLVIAVVLAVLIPLWLIGELTTMPPPGTPPPDESKRDSVVIDLPTTRKWVVEREAFPKYAEHPRQMRTEGYLPHMVSDKLMPENTDNYLPTRQETHDLVDLTTGTQFGGGVPGLGVISRGGGAGGKYPTIDSFVAVEKPPEMVFKNEPDYPQTEKRLGLEGVVIIKALVDIDGTVADAVVWKSCDVKALDEAALEAAYLNRYTPAMQNGRPVAIWVTYRVEFVLDN